REDSGATTDDKALTNAGSMLGSPLYMSPEQMQASAAVDLRTDIWSLGVILYELVTGRSPFDAKTIPVICAAVLSQPPPPLDLPDAPAGLERVILRCLEKDPAKRYRDIAHLVRALAPFAKEQAAVTADRVAKLRDDSGAVAASPATVPPPPKEGSLTITSWNARPETTPKRRWLPIAFAGVGVLVVGVFAIQSATQPPPSNQSGVQAEPAPADHAAEGTSRPAPVPAATVVATSDPGATPPATSEAATSEPMETSAVASADAPASASASGALLRKPVQRPTSWTKPTPAKTSKTAGFGGRE
ncbi:MAG: protein kinase, partial [Polyangiaceae bacterium]|nr:protein kinase [Polyangiaceae bacterium]